MYRGCILIDESDEFINPIRKRSRSLASMSIRNIIHAIKFEKVFGEGEVRCKIHKNEHKKALFFMFVNDTSILEIIPFTDPNFRELVVSLIDYYAMQKSRNRN